MFSPPEAVLSGRERFGHGPELNHRRDRRYVFGLGASEERVQAIVELFQLLELVNDSPNQEVHDKKLAHEQEQDEE